jgi:hypothetical protein
MMRPNGRPACSLFRKIGAGAAGRAGSNLARRPASLVVEPWIDELRRIVPLT